MSNPPITSPEYLAILFGNLREAVKFSNFVPTEIDYDVRMAEPELRELAETVMRKAEGLLGNLLQFVDPGLGETEFTAVVDAADRCLENVDVSLERMKGGANRMV